MTKPMEYKGYLGSVEVDLADKILHGKLLFIKDVIGYHAEHPGELEAAFHAAVDDYLETCEEMGDAPDVPCKGSFNVRMPPELHQKLVLEAQKVGVSLNEFVRLACEDAIEAPVAKPAKVQVSSGHVISAAVLKERSYGLSFHEEEQVATIPQDWIAEQTQTTQILVKH